MKRDREEHEEDCCVFISEDLCKPWQLEKAAKLRCRVTRTWCKGVTHVVTSSQWLANKRGFEYLFLLTQASVVEHVVSFDWVLSCVSAGGFLRNPGAFVLSDAALESARQQSTLVFAGHLVAFSGLFLQHRSEQEFRDLFLLVLLQGACILDHAFLFLTKGGFHRGFYIPTMLPADAQPFDSLRKHIVVSSRDCVSHLGLEIYATWGYRPILSEWIPSCIVQQKICAKEKYELYG